MVILEEVEDDIETKTEGLRLQPHTMENNAERAPVIPSCGVSQQGEQLETDAIYERNRNIDISLECEAGHRAVHFSS